MISSLLNGRALSEKDAEAIFGRLVRGEMGEVEMTALLVGLKMAGETPSVIAGAARALRAAALPFDAGLDVADSCGTGGDGAHTFNVSTVVALVVAECGVRVAKHGNRSISSKCGSADVLEALGIGIETSPEVARRALHETGICYLHAPAYHAGLRHAATVRRALGVRTILNLLGPLVNPARPRWQVVGVYDPRWCVPMAETLGRLGCERALVVHGGGLDEVAPHAPTTAAFLSDGEVREMTIHPADVGLPSHDLAALAGGDAETNARILRELLEGRGKEAQMAAVALNAGALLMVAGKAGDLREGVASARAVLRSDRGWQRLQAWREVQRGAR